VSAAFWRRPLCGGKESGRSFIKQVKPPKKQAL